MSARTENSGDLRHQIARAIWLSMVNDEAPPDETLEREGYVDAADAVLELAVPRDDAAIERATRALVDRRRPLGVGLGAVFAAKLERQAREDAIAVLRAAGKTPAPGVLLDDAYIDSLPETPDA